LEECRSADHKRKRRAANQPDGIRFQRDATMPFVMSSPSRDISYSGERSEEAMTPSDFSTPVEMKEYRGHICSARDGIARGRAL